MLDGWAAERLFESDTTGGNILHVTYAKELKTEMLRDDVNELKEIEIGRASCRERV